MRPTALPWEEYTHTPIDWLTRLRITYGRTIRWEFWPAWLYYVPIVIWILLLAIRYRSLTLFTAANPVIETGGFVGEHKHITLDLLQTNAPDLAASFIMIPVNDVDTRKEIVLKFVAQVGFPVVLKPNIGGRGRGVMIARHEQDIHDYLTRCTGEIMAQRYVEGIEFGIFVARHPDTQEPDVLSIVHKTFPSITADGQRTLRELILQDERARLISKFLFNRWAQELQNIPLKGEVITLVEIGAHCRGSVFLDGSHLNTPALRTTLARLMDAVPGYAFGRLDLRVPSMNSLINGEGLQIIELNGVTAESAHIYHPGTPITQGYRAMFHQWSTAFSIGHAHAKRGIKVTSLRELLKRWREDMQRSESWF